MPTLNGFSAWIEVDGERVDEHSVDIDADGKTAKCWVASEEGKHFLVYWEDLRMEIPTIGNVTVDGQWADSPILEPRNWIYPAVCSGACIDDDSEAPFEFAAVDLTDDEEAACANENIIKNLGTISIEIKRIVLGGKGKMNHAARAQLGSIHETAFKAGAHHVALGPITSSACHETLSFSPWNPADPSPHVNFIFQYRPLGILKALNVFEAPAPQTRQSARRSADNEEEQKPRITPEQEDNEQQPGEGEEGGDEEGGVDSEEERRLQKELARVKAKLAKRKQGEVAGPSTKRVKREPN